MVCRGLGVSSLGVGCVKGLGVGFKSMVCRRFRTTQCVEI